MSSYTTLSATQTGVGEAIVKFKKAGDDFRSLINVGVLSGAATYSVEYALTPEQDVWVALGTTDRTGNTDDSLSFPVYAVRARVTGGAGTIKLIVKFTNN